jgi:hypothetical protein
MKKTEANGRICPIANGCKNSHFKGKATVHIRQTLCGSLKNYKIEKLNFNIYWIYFLYIY